MSCGFVRFFQKASELARREGLPRVYVSCNSGARVGLVEELKPLYKVKWLDPADCNKGFERLGSHSIRVPTKPS